MKIIIFTALFSLAFFVTVMFSPVERVYAAFGDCEQFFSSGGGSGSASGTMEFLDGNGMEFLDGTGIDFLDA